MSNTDDYQEIVVQRDDGLDYKFQGRLLIDVQWGSDVEFAVEYYCGIIQIYECQYPQGKHTGKGYILRTRRHQGVGDSMEVAVTEAGLVKDMPMTIQLILVKFRDSDGFIPKWVKKAIDEFKSGQYVEASGVMIKDG